MEDRSSISLRIGEAIVAAMRCLNEGRDSGDAHKARGLYIYLPEAGQGNVGFAMVPVPDGSPGGSRFGSLDELPRAIFAAVEAEEAPRHRAELVQRINGASAFALAQLRARFDELDSMKTTAMKTA